MDYVPVPTIGETTRQDDLEKIFGRGVVCLLCFANIFDMGGGFGLKYVSFGVALLYLSLNPRFLPLDVPINFLMYGLFFVWPVLSLLLGILAGADVALAVTQTTPFVAALVFFMVLQTVTIRPVLSVFFGTMYSLAIFVIVMYGLIWFRQPAGDFLLTLFSSEAHGYFGRRDFGAIVLPNVYFKATLFLVPAYVYYVYGGKLVKASLILLALLLAFSKAGFVICLLFTLGYPFFSASKRRFTSAFVLIALLSAPWLFGYQEFTEELILSLTGQSETSQIRLGYFDSLYALLGESPLTLLVGQGAGVGFYAHNLGAFVANIELDHLNVIRKYGLPWFMVFAALVLMLAYKLFRSDLQESRILGLALLSIFIAAGTNPVLLSPPFLMFLLMTLVYYRRRHAAAH
jgi:hypothetical protein